MYRKLKIRLQHLFIQIIQLGHLLDSIRLLVCRYEIYPFFSAIIKYYQCVKPLPSSYKFGAELFF